VPTIREVCGAKQLTEWEGIAVPAAPGKSLLPVFDVDTSLDHDHLWWFHDGHKAVRIGYWKLVAAKGEPWELYDIKADRAEQHDLAAKYPDKVETLAARWAQSAAEFTTLAKSDQE
jgi:arylsulfatase